mmetsp:Transcript_1356/g.1828  ORF Transcript_1356/g.1828 Transcript_1356/m.1828 type:complete len:250 (-) Transcript_1356:542-1291(-)
MQAFAAIRGFEKSDKGHVIYSIEVSFNQNQWMIFRRYNDFITLFETLRDEGRQPSSEPPPKKFFGRFDPNFLKERSDQLQDYMETVVREVSVVESEGLRNFLEFSNHVDWDFSGIGAYGNGSEMSTLVEQERLSALIEETAHILVDISRMGGDELDPAQMKAQRRALFKAADGFKAHVAQLQESMQPTVPVPSAKVKSQDAIVDCLSRPSDGSAPLVLERVGMALADRLREITKIQLDEGQELVCHMQS